LFSVDDEQMGVMLDPWYREFEDIAEDEPLSEGDEHWELLVYATNSEWLRDPDLDATANMTLSMDYPEMSDEEFLGVVYPAAIDMFEEEYGGEVDFLGYPEVPDEYL
jgi:hypothetical protein